MQTRIPPQSANDNGPLTPGQVKVLKIAIGVMSVMIIAGLIAVVGRVIYLASNSGPAPAASTIGEPLLPQHRLALPAGAVVETVALEGNRLLVHYTQTGVPSIVVLDLETGKVVSQVAIVPKPPQ